ncbi:tyrosine-type recombinase/integrase [Lentzea sp. NPDC055074]
MDRFLDSRKKDPLRRVADDSSRLLSCCFKFQHPRRAQFGTTSTLSPDNDSRKSGVIVAFGSRITLAVRVVDLDRADVFDEASRTELVQEIEVLRPRVDPHLVHRACDSVRHDRSPAHVSQRVGLDHSVASRLGERWLILITTGLRKGEVLGLAWSDVDLETGAFKVRRTVQRVRGKLLFGKTKTKKSTRSLYLGRVCLAALRKHREETAKRQGTKLNPAPGQPSDLIFVTATGRVIEPRNVNTMLRRLLKGAELDPARVHDLRHTAATLLLMDGATIREVMEQLGHASISTTANIYGHVLDEAKRRLATRMDRLSEPE